MVVVTEGMVAARGKVMTRVAPTTKDHMAAEVLQVVLEENRNGTTKCDLDGPVYFCCRPTQSERSQPYLYVELDTAGNPEGYLTSWSLSMIYVFEQRQSSSCIGILVAFFLGISVPAFFMVPAITAINLTSTG